MVEMIHENKIRKIKNMVNFGDLTDQVDTAICLVFLCFIFVFLFNFLTGFYVYVLRRAM